MSAKNINVIFDTNVWISFLIGKRLQIIQDYIADGRVTIVVTDQLLQEIREVTARPKLKKYFPRKKVMDLIELLDVIAINKPVKPIATLSKDPKDNFLLDLITSSRADILVTGDKELLEIGKYRSASILSPNQFEEYLKK